MKKVEYAYTTQKQVRQAFKELCSDYKTSKKHNDQTATVRSDFSFFLDTLRKDGLISEKMANNCTM